MNGLLATDLIEISDDPSALDSGGFWAVSTTFEGRQTYAKFANVIRGAAFPEVGRWEGLDGIWQSSISQSDFEKYVEEIRSELRRGMFIK